MKYADNYKHISCHINSNTLNIDKNEAIFQQNICNAISVY